MINLHLLQNTLVITGVITLPPNIFALDAIDIPRVNTPAPAGAWPQSNITGCGFTGLPYTGVLSECTEPLNPDAPDIIGYWRNQATGDIDELVEQCGSRWIDISKPVIHDFPECTGVIGDGLGCQDYSALAIIHNDTLCSPITVACKFEKDEEGNKCVNLYVPNAVTNDPMKMVSRCLQSDGSMIWVHPVFGTVSYEKVASEDEPNCVTCVGGEFDGVSTSETDEELPCAYEERQWIKCDEAVSGCGVNGKSGGKSGGKSKKGKSSGADAVEDPACAPTAAPSAVGKTKSKGGKAGDKSGKAGKRES